MGCSLYACKRLRGARRASLYQTREVRRKDNVGFSPLPHSALGFFSFSVGDVIADFSYIPAENICPRWYRVSWKTSCRAPFSGISVSRIREKSYLRDTTLLKSRPGQTGNFCQFCQGGTSLDEEPIDR